MAGPKHPKEMGLGMSCKKTFSLSSNNYSMTFETNYETTNKIETNPFSLTKVFENEP